MKHRDVEDPAVRGTDLPDDNMADGSRIDDLEPESAIRPIDLPKRADLSRSGQARRLGFGRTRRRSVEPLEPAQPLDPQTPEPPERGAASSRLQEYVRTRGIRGRVAAQAHPVATPERRERVAPTQPATLPQRATPAPAAPVASRTDAATVEPAPAAPPSSQLRSAHPLARLRLGEGPRNAGAVRPALRRRAARPGVSPAAILRALRRAGFRAFFGLTGAVATIAIVGALVVALPNQPATPEPTGGSIYGVTWSAAAQAPDVNFDFGPYLVSTGSAVLMAGTTGSTTTVWSSTDGSTWTKISDPDAFTLAGRRFVAQGMSDDGNGGLVIVGNSVGSGATDVVATAWYSADGRTWSKASVDAGAGQEMIGGVAARPGGIVAAGNGIAWFSTDGSSWQPEAMPAAEAFIPREVGAWDGGFAIVALASGAATTRSAVWYSPTGTTWTQASTVLDGFDARGIAGSGKRVMVVGSDTSDTAEGLAVSWTSTDGDKWTKATAPTTQTTAAIDGVTVLDGSFVAVGAPEPTASNTGEPSQTPATEDTWISDDGLGWLSLSTTGDPLPRGHVSSVGGQLVLAGPGDQSMAVYDGAVRLGPPRVATVSATPAIVYSLDLTAGTVPMIPDVTSSDTLGPVVATSDRFVAFTTGGAGTSVWTSTDGGHLWAQEAKPASLTAEGNSGRPVVLEAIGDGHGGVLAIGSVTNADGSTGTIWHRTTDGWHQVTIQDDAPPEFSSIAAGDDGYVASSDKAGGSPLMYSTDGETWYASTIAVGDGFALTVGTYRYGFVAVGTNAERGGSSAAWTSPDGRTWTLRSDWKLPPNVTALFGVGRFLVATSTVTPGVEAPTTAPSPAAGATSAAPTAKPKATPKPTPTPTPPPPYTQWWWSGTGQAWQQTDLQTSSANFALVNQEIFVIDPPAQGETNWTTWSSSDGRTWIQPQSDAISFPGGTVCALASLDNNLVIVGWAAPGQLEGYFGKLLSNS